MLVPLRNMGSPVAQLFEGVRINVCSSLGWFGGHASVVRGKGDIVTAGALGSLQGPRAPPDSLLAPPDFAERHVISSAYAGRPFSRLLALFFADGVGVPVDAGAAGGAGAASAAGGS